MQLCEMWDKLKWQSVWMHLLPAADVTAAQISWWGRKKKNSQRYSAVYENLISQLFLFPAGSSRLTEL